MVQVRSRDGASQYGALLRRQMPESSHLREIERGRVMKRNVGGNITKRGKNSWRLKFDVGVDAGKRQTKYHTFKGTRKEAQVKLAELIASAANGSYVEPSKLYVGDFVAARLDQWEA